MLGGGQKIAVITGASQGIGFSIARLFASRGYYVVALARNEQKLQDAKNLIIQEGGQAAAYGVDITSRVAVEKVFERIFKEIGLVTSVVNNAGTPINGGFLQTDPDEWEKGIALHVHGSYYVSWYAAKHMLEAGGGSIINMSSAAGVNPPLGLPLYAGAKGSLIALTRAMAVDLAPHQITVNAICPGPVDTATFRQSTPPDVYRERAWSIPHGRLIDPLEIAETAFFLCSSGARSITGETVLIDGGAAATGPYAIGFYKQRMAVHANN